MSEVLWRALDYLRQGGWTMIPLLGCSLFMWLLILERWDAFRRLAHSDLDLGDSLRALNEGDAVCGDGLRCRLMREFLRLRSGDLELDRRILQQCVLGLRNGLRSRLAAIAVLASVAPLLGLLGTVLGMIETFDVISIFGTGNAKGMAGGISVALITTQSGLLVAIPGLLISGNLARRARSFERRLDEAATVLDRHLRRGGAPPSSTPEVSTA
jgi:biopolymer transport protein ExbB